MTVHTTRVIIQKAWAAPAGRVEMDDAILVYFLRGMVSFTVHTPVLIVVVSSSSWLYAYYEYERE